MDDATCEPEASFEHDPWYKYGVILLYAEMGIAICVTLYSLYLAFTGAGGIGGH
ncbi:MAG: hypothetical protein ABEL76_07580 [Bradymonadaceae bacterium]